VRLEPGAAKSFWKEGLGLPEEPNSRLLHTPDAPQYYVRVISTRGAIYYAAAQTKIAFAHMEEKQHGNKKAH
jgi:hypothetical protein